MNKQFHSLIVQGAGSKVMVEAIERNDRIPFAAAHAIAFDRVDLPRRYDLLLYSHRQHHAIVQALQNGEGESYVRERLWEGINMSRTVSRSGAGNGESSPFELK